MGRKHLATFSTMNDLAILYRKQLLYNEVENLLIEAFEGRRPKLKDNHPHTIEWMNKLITLYEALKKPEKAEEWRAKMPPTEALV